ncbi:MAG: mechanosensitive ion channel family protein [Anaerolineales bacterium]|nr:mechanosensitive ion channel family protein [Anaerolineales bacterium]
MNINVQQLLYDPMVGKIIFAFVGILVLVVLVRFSQRVFGRRIAQTKSRYFVRKLITLAGYLVGILFVSIVFSDQLGHLTVAFGVAGAGIAFALQEVIVSIAGWIAVSLGHFYHVGDRVQLGGIMGDVIDVGVLRTTIMECGEWVNSDQYNGRIVRVANSFVFKEPVFNYSADFPFLWDEITVPIKYGCDYRLARKILIDVANDVVGSSVEAAKKSWKQVVGKFMVEDELVEPIVTLTANDNWIEFTVRYVVDYKRRRVIKDEIFVRILEALDKTEGQIAIASTTFHIVETPVFNVRLNRSEESPSDLHQMLDSQSFNRESGLTGPHNEEGI